MVVGEDRVRLNKDLSRNATSKDLVTDLGSPEGRIDRRHTFVQGPAGLDVRCGLVNV